MIIEYIRKTGRSILAGAMLAGALFCIGCSESNPYAGKKLEEVVAIASSPRKAQDFIDYNIDYAYEDLNAQRETALNGAEIQSFRKTFDRKKGVCRDGAIAVAAMLQDDGFPARILDVCWTGGDWGGHSVFVYQNSEGRWGSAGINASDYREPRYTSLEDLARDVPGQWDGNYTGFTLYDLSLVDLVEGTNNGLVAKEPFIKERASTSWASSINYTILKTPKGFEHSWTTALQGNTCTNHDTYTEDLFLDERNLISEKLGSVYEEHWIVLQRACCGLPAETMRTITLNYETRTTQTWTAYTWFNKILQENIERRTQGLMETYSIDTREYNPDQIIAAQQLEVSTDGDYTIDQITRFEFNADGSTTTYFDKDADGKWDSTTTNH